MMMTYQSRLLGAFLCMSCAMIDACVNNQPESNIERKKEMNNQSEQQPGQFLAKDNFGASVILEWTKTSIVAPEFAVAMASMWSFARDAYTPVEMQFLRAFPEVVGAEPYFKLFEPLFENGREQVDWKAAEEIMQAILKGHFVFDPAQLPEAVVKSFAQDACFLVTIKDQETGEALGFITFLKRANYAAGEVKVMSLAVEVTHQSRGLGRLLMSSIFKIIPDLKRIFLCTRVTNETALKAYSAWGFIKDEAPVLDHAFNLAHWSFMEYKSDQSDVLQKTADGMSEIKTELKQ